MHELHSRLRARAAESATATALVDHRRSVSYAQLVAAVDATAATLSASTEDGARWGVRVGNDIDSVMYVLALSRAGRVPVLIDTKARDPEIASIAGLAQLSGVLDPRRDGVEGPALPLDAPCGTAFGLVSSGTNGIPKVVRRDWRATVAGCRSFASAATYRPADTVLCTTPLHHSYAFGCALVSGLLTGSTVVLAPAPSTPAALSALMTQCRPDVIQSVPFFYRALLDAGVPALLSPPRVCISAGEALDPAVTVAWREAFASGLRNHYGTTESGVLTLAAPSDTDSVGHSLPGVDIRVVNADAEPAPEGEILVRSPGPPSDYWGQPDLNRETFRTGWHRTGDWGHHLPDGRLVLTGRTSQRIVVGGRKVDPAEVETVLRGHRSVRECMITGLPAGTGQAGFVAFVAADGVTEIDLRRYLAERISAYKVPTRLVIVAELPRTGTQKVHLAKLWHEWAKR